MTQIPVGAPVLEQPSPAEIFRCFAYIGATGFGGVLPIALHELVERRRWLTHEEFAEILSLCQILPGPNVMNMAIVFGMRAASWRGVAASVVGITALPIAIVLMLATLYTGFADVPAVAQATSAVASAAAGLICAMSLKLLWPMRRQPARLAVVAVTMALMLLLRMPLLFVIGGLAPVSLALAFWDYRRAG